MRYCTEVARGHDRGCAWCGATPSHSQRTHPHTHTHTTHTHTRTVRWKSARRGTCPRCWPYEGLAWYAGSRNSMAVLMASPRRTAAHGKACRRRFQSGRNIEPLSPWRLGPCMPGLVHVHALAITLAASPEPRPPPPASDLPPLHRATRVAVETRRRCQ